MDQFRFKKYVKIMSQHAAKLDDVDKELFRLISSGIGHNIFSFDENQWQKLLPVPAALRWELIWRISPGLADDAFGKNEFLKHSNPFFDPEIVEHKFWQESLTKLNEEIANIEGFTLLSRSFEIEISKFWPYADHVSWNQLLKPDLYRESDIKRIQEYLSRIYLRGEQEQVITALNNHVEVIFCTIDNSDSMEEIMTDFTDSLLPLFGLAYCRIRDRTINPFLSRLSDKMDYVKNIITQKIVNLENINASIHNEHQFTNQRTLNILNAMNRGLSWCYSHLSDQPLEGRSEAWDRFVQELVSKVDQRHEEVHSKVKSIKEDEGCCE